MAAYALHVRHCSDIVSACAAETIDSVSAWLRLSPDSSVGNCLLQGPGSGEAEMLAHTEGDKFAKLSNRPSVFRNLLKRIRLQ